MRPVDPRRLRTRGTLRGVVYTIAAHKPIGRVTVAEIARAANVTRDTVYRHGSDPVQLLASLLDEEMAEFVRHVDLSTRAEDRDSVFDDGERELLRHIVDHWSVYRNAMNPRLIGPIRDVLIDRISQGLRDYLAHHPEVAPARDPAVDPDLHLQMLVGYAAGGTVAAIEEWLRAGDPSDEDAAARTVLAASPEWWLQRPGR